MRSDPAMDKLCIDTIRTLAMDAVQKANSGHAGAPMGRVTGKKAIRSGVLIGA